MNDKEFMELLENVRSEIIAYNDNDVFTVGDILDLINCKDAEIEMLNIRNKTLTAITKNYDWKFAKAKSEAIKEFAEMIIREYPEADYFIRNLLKEMEGEDN